jgi:two-component system LytT family response regulator
MTIRVVVVDDEPIARRRLKRLLAAIGGVELVGEAGDGRAALEVLERTRPHLVLLDIQMPEGDGLAVMRRVPLPRPLVVFVTAFDAFAVQAFDVQAVDYLLKPVSEDRLAAALDRVRERIGSPRSGQSRRWIERLPIRREGRIDLVPVADIDWIEAADNYAIVHAGRRSHILRETLTRLEAELDPSRFVRVHRSTIVRVDRIARLDVALRGDYDLTLRDGTQLVLSRTFRGRLARALGRDF